MFWGQKVSKVFWGQEVSKYLNQFLSTSSLYCPETY
jgi:hypothetical protein